MAKALEATEHLDQKLACFFDATTDSLANLRQYLNLKSIWRTNHPNEASNLHHATPTALSETQPDRSTFLGGTQTLLFKPLIHSGRNAMQTVSATDIRVRCRECVEFVDRDAVHRCSDVQTTRVW